MFGVLNVSKPPGTTSRNVVDVLQRLVKPHKVGHAGTLDPLATGVLLVCVGRATRLIEYAHRLPKSYRATFWLGRRSDTEDIDGTVTHVADASHLTREDVERVLPQFQGHVSQVPPAYSALRVKGQRAYALARAGQDVQLAPRMISVHSLRVVAYAYPALTIDVDCGSGTYIRSLGRDLARAVGTEAVMAQLVRTAIGTFSIDAAVDPGSLSLDNISRCLLPPTALVPDLPQVTLHDDETEAISRGMFIENRFGISVDEMVALDTKARLVAILTPRGDGMLGSVRNFVGRG